MWHTNRPPRSSRAVVVTVVVATLLGVTPTSAALCTKHLCSNDHVVPLLSGEVDPNYGDERMTWYGPQDWLTKSCPTEPSEPCTTPSDVRCYRIATWPELEVVKSICETTVWSGEAWIYRPAQTFFDPYKLPPDRFPVYGALHRYVVQACEGQECGPWQPKTDTGDQDWVGFLGVDYACLASVGGVRCESSCYPGAPKMLSELPDCSDLKK